MLDFNEIWEKLTSIDETDTIEAKYGSGIGDSILTTISAFSNEPETGGGYIILGVSKREESMLFPDYQINGVQNSDQLQNIVATRCRSEFSITIRPQIKVENVEDKTVLIIFIPEAQPSEKPVYIRKKGVEHGTYRRIGSTDQKCVDEDLEELYQGRKNQSLDAMPVTTTSLDDIDDRAIAAYRRLRAEVKKDAEELTYTNEELLKALGGILTIKGETCLTTAGLILFGTPAALRRELPMMRVDYMRVNGREWLADPERPYDDLIEYRDPLMLMIPRIAAQIEEDIPRAFLLPPDSLQRQDVPLIPRRVIREAVVNALIHRSYRIYGATQIIRFSNRIEIINPGFSLLSPERFGERGATRPRNPQIANVAHEVNFAETKGTGIRRMFDTMNDANLTLPLIESDRIQNSFSVKLSTVHFMEEEDVEWLKNFAVASLSDDESKALVFVRNTGVITNSIYRELNRVNIVEASRDLLRLRDLKLLETQSKGAGTYYVPGMLMKQAEGEAYQITKSDLPDSQLSGRSGIPDNKQTIPLPGLPSHLADLINNLGQRAARQDIEYAIWKLCDWRTFQVREIAAFLQRNQKYVQTQFLAPMVKEGRLVHSYPDIPAHPQQAYKAAKTSKG